MIRPFDDIKPGDALSAGELNRANEEHERNALSEVVAPLEQTWGAEGRIISLNTRPSIWVRITGRMKCADNPSGCSGSDTGSGCGVCGSGGGGSCSYPLYHYSGYQQNDENCTPDADFAGGMEFFVDQYFLKEVEGKTNVPINAIVRAYPSDNGPYYTFKYASTAGTSPSGTKPIRTYAPAIDPDTGYSIIPLDAGFYAYLGIIQGLPADFGTPPDTGELVWLAPYYQEGIWGALPNMGLQVGKAYSGIDMNSNATGTVDLQNGEGGSSNIVTATLPVFYCMFSPGRIICSGDPQNPTFLEGTA